MFVSIYSFLKFYVKSVYKITLLPKKKLEQAISSTFGCCFCDHVINCTSGKNFRESTNRACRNVVEWSRWRARVRAVIMCRRDLPLPIFPTQLDLPDPDLWVIPLMTVLSASSRSLLLSYSLSENPIDAIISLFVSHLLIHSFMVSLFDFGESN